MFEATGAESDVSEMGQNNSLGILPPQTAGFSVNRGAPLMDLTGRWMLYLASSGRSSGAHLREQEHLFTALQTASPPYQKPPTHLKVYCSKFFPAEREEQQKHCFAITTHCAAECGSKHFLACINQPQSFSSTFITQSCERLQTKSNCLLLASSITLLQWSFKATGTYFPEGGKR